MDWIFELPSGRYFMSSRDTCGEGRVHIALKMLGLLVLQDEDPEMEPKRKKHHRKYKPDVISGDGSIWCEAGKVSRKKLLEISNVSSIESVLVMKPSFYSAKDMASRFPSDTSADVVFYGWDGIQDVADAISGHCKVRMFESRPVGFYYTDDGKMYERHNYRLVMDGDVFDVSSSQFRPSEVGDSDG
jgi:hypothetical protein